MAVVAARSYRVSCEEARIENDNLIALVAVAEDVSYTTG